MSRELLEQLLGDRRDVRHRPRIAHNALLKLIEPLALARYTNRSRPTGGARARVGAAQPALLVLVGWVVMMALAACGGSVGPGVAGTEVPPAGPSTRALRIDTLGCGDASGRVGSAVAFDDGLAVTAAHLVVRSEAVTATIDGGPGMPADVVAYDLRRDLALLRIPQRGIGRVDTARGAAGDAGEIVGAAVSGSVPFEVVRAVRLWTEEILGTQRHPRLGYELDAATRSGDSGAGAYDTEGRLVGVVFATSAEGGATWLTASEEIESFVEDALANGARPVCEPGASRLVTDPAGG